MSDKFNGFSQEEINRVSGTKNNNNKKSSTNSIPAMETKRPATFRGHGGIRRVPDKSESSSSRQVKKLQTVNQNFMVNNKNLADKLKSLEANDSIMEEINLDDCMSKSIEEALFYQPLKNNAQTRAESHNAIASTKSITTESLKTTKSTANRENLNKNEASSHRAAYSSSSSSSTSIASGFNDSSILKLNNEYERHISSSANDTSILPSSSASSATNGKAPTLYTPPSSLNVESPFRGISLKDFETHRKMIEEQNRQKKDLLYKVIEQHSQKTAAEARKIEEIKAELSKLDNDLAVDVAVLRKQIEIACIHFANVEKQYMKIESQFLKAKLELHNAAEKKELLTEHLCTVIAHNEDRKAQKLSELMEKVGLAATNAGEYEAPSSTSN